MEDEEADDKDEEDEGLGEESTKESVDSNQLLEAIIDTIEVQVFVFGTDAIRTYERTFAGLFDQKETCYMMLHIVWCLRHGMKDELIPDFVVRLVDLCEEQKNALESKLERAVSKHICRNHKLIWLGINYFRYFCEGSDFSKRPQDWTTLRTIYIVEENIIPGNDLALLKNHEQVEEIIAPLDRLSMLGNDGISINYIIA
ncbi:hypothetical protein GH714_024666 [Hevea brasiliensis]|uniref:Uncharacterized protein n=1 Tax=Hevea brasiliensis TaxID=3981 RepID=A0A6A6MUV2_HEVBR|nr:hypothetical protein GH714_024666 [Hevea brasiliensis]